MAFVLGPETEQLLLLHGVDPASIEEIREGTLTWELFGGEDIDDVTSAAIEAAERDPVSLMLITDEGGVLPIAQLTAEESDQLIDVASYESRPPRTDDSDEAFPPGSYWLMRSKNRFTVSTQPPARGLCFSPPERIDSSKRVSRSFCSVVRLTGVSTATLANRSPLRGSLTVVTPLPRKRNTLPDCVPAGTFRET